MSEIVIVPDVLHEAIVKKLEAALSEVPDARKDYKHLYGQLLDYYHENGVIPDFTLTKKP